MNPFQDESFLVNRVTGKRQPVSFRRLTSEHAADVAALQKAVLEEGGDLRLYHPLSDAEIDLMMERQGMTMGAFVHEELVAFHTVYFPHFGDDNLGRDVGVCEKDLLRVAHFEAVCVHPVYRGNGLQKQLADGLVSLLYGTPYDLLFETVSPLNLPSLRNILSTGFVIRGLKDKYGQEQRYIMFRERDSSFRLGGQEVKVPLSDNDAQRSLLEKGYAGVQSLEEEGRRWLLLRQFFTTCDT